MKGIIKEVVEAPDKKFVELEGKGMKMEEAQQENAP